MSWLRSLLQNELQGIMKRHLSLRRLMDPLKGTPLHPQWFVFREQSAHLQQVASWSGRRVLDVGAGEQKIRSFLRAGTCYTSLDYYFTASEWYHVRPNVYGDAQVLPFAPSSVDTVLLLDVLEHLPRPSECIAEIHRVLQPKGRLILQVPFLYPLHDVPLDFHRWTLYGLRNLAHAHGFAVHEEIVVGSPMQSAALTTNIASSSTAMDWLARKSPLALLSMLLPFFIFAVNVFAWLLDKFCSGGTFMPRSYRVVWIKTE
jgi:SAM-dependent methyltransferase